MSELSTDVRGFLHYVPYFRGKTFVLDLDWGVLGESAKAEILMDLSALQSIGVRLVLVLSEQCLDDFLDWSVDLELRTSSVKDGSVGGASEVMGRGQVALMERDGGILSGSLVELAVGVGAAKIIVLSECDALTSGGEVLKFLRVAEVGEVDGGGDMELLGRAVDACSKGVKRVHLLDARQPGVLLDELFSNEGVGTMVYADNYREIRPLREEDVSELLGMIGRSVRNTHLVPRTYEEIASHIGDYAVMEVDDHVVGCVALYRYEGIGEVACLYVKQAHGSTGYGADLVTYMEAEARKKGVPAVFALTNRAAEFFERLGYVEMSADDLPAERLGVLRASGRDSRAFLKTF